ncbi:S-adenosyl-L-methionine-dependent methyltransferase [Bombardia bombarda]|uniref:S-adenosyl-L-methionine-dependent methyltransferase n=1 Tax=Bombardia bombarda TaxID=252184 RepID=A0AA39WGT4_9PEZI|nr:S-adenosyl-L-methionine-dependent methyltransferase [Bombardia bombarda]
MDAETYARHVAHNDPEREYMLAGDHLNETQFPRGGLSVDSDADSAMGDIDGAPSTSSLRSSIYQYVEEYGRTFHKYKQGSKCVCVCVCVCELALLRVATEHPSAHVIGTDLSPIQPEYVPANCHFEVDDADDDWIFSHPFDYIHLRMIFHSFRSHKEVMRSGFENLLPGGWIEYQDYYCHLQSVDGTLQGTALERWSQLYVEGGLRLGRDMLAPRKYKQWMEETGYVNVTEQKLVIPGNPWPKGHDLKLLGAWQMANFLEGIHAVTMTIFTRGLGMSSEEVELLLVDVRKDIKNLGVHFYFLT